MNKIISVMGPHAGETAEIIFERKIEDVKRTGLTFWCIESYKAKPDQVQELCNTTQVEVYFISPSSPGGAKDTKTETKNTQYSIDKKNYLQIPQNITPVTGKGSALILDQLQNVNEELDLNQYAEFNKNTPLKFALGCSTICAIKKDMSSHPDRVKSNKRKIWAKGRLREPFCVWIK
jgi:hypothetical protein|tara:strand:- start:36 stop:566 length:531 start_codon:yes stop_codon:yes gene_type:complete